MKIQKNCFRLKKPGKQPPAEIEPIVIIKSYRWQAPWIECSGMALVGLGCRSVLENCVALAGPGVEREKDKNRGRCKL